MVSQGVDYELAVAELPPGYFFPNPQSTLENVIGSFVGTDGGSVVARVDAPFAGNPALFLRHQGRQPGGAGVRLDLRGTAST